MYTSLVEFTELTRYFIIPVLQLPTKFCTITTTVKAQWL